MKCDQRCYYLPSSPPPRFGANVCNSDGKQRREPKHDAELRRKSSSGPQNAESLAISFTGRPCRERPAFVFDECGVAIAWFWIGGVRIRVWIREPDDGPFAPRGVT